MFDDLVEAAMRARGASAIGPWARVENAAAARRLSSMADLLEAKLAEMDSAAREQWCLDNWDAASAEIAAGQGVSLGVASNELLVAWELRQRLPRVAEVFAAGVMPYRLARLVVSRTRLVTDRDAQAKIDTEIAAQISGWGPLSKAKQEAEIDYWVDRYDPAAVVRAESASRSCHVDVVMAEDGSGVCFVEAVLFAHDGEVMDARLEEMARGVCKGDPRTLDQRRSQAMGAIMAKADRLQCLCGADDCPAAARTPSADRELRKIVVRRVKLGRWCARGVRYVGGRWYWCGKGQQESATRYGRIPINAETCIRIFHMTGDLRGRRPQWRGHRKAILIRVPLPLAEELTAVAQESSESISDAAGRLISVALAAREGGLA